jgi:site-specific recombinase XerC
MFPELLRFQSFLRRKNPHSSTHIHYTSDLKIFFAVIPKSPNEITLIDIDAFIEHSHQKGYAIATINRRLAAIRSFYTFLNLESDDAPKNPVLSKRHFIRQGQRLPRDARDEDLDHLFHFVDHPRDRAIFLLMLRCGLRVGETRNLSLPDLYLLPLPGSLPRIWLNGKGSAQRVAYLSNQPLSALLRWLVVRPDGSSSAVFTNKFGRRMTVTGIQDRLARYCCQAGIWITCHQLRHTFGRHLAEARIPVTSIQRLLGHARLRTTQIYLHISDKQVQEDYAVAMREVSRRLCLEGGAS